MIRRNEFSLRAFCLSSIVWYLTVVVGWSGIVYGLYRVSTTASLHMPGAFIMIAALLFVLELLPLVQGRGHDPQGVVMSTAFVCAMLFIWGPWPAVLMLALASLASDLRARKQWWKTLFNPAQYSISVGSAELAMWLFGAHHRSLHHPLHGLGLHSAGWIIAAWVTYFTVNLGLVAGVLSWSSSFRSLFTEDFTHYATVTFSVLAVSPLVVIVAQTNWVLTPLLLIPLLLLYFTAQMALEREHAAGHDALTGLPNRTSLQFELDEALREFHRQGRTFGLMVIDMNDFKRVNDTLGHQVGDSLLISIARRLRDAVRESDHVARLGGDEFAVVVFNATSEEIYNVAERIREAVINPVRLSGMSLEVGVSIGIAECPTHGADATTLLRRADVAMYVAKDTHSDIEIYSPETDENSTDRLTLLGELRQALEDDELELFYQPKLHANDASPIGVEALVRWRHPVRGYVPPDEFIPLAERSGIMPILTARVVTLALAQMATWRAQGMDVPVAVNVTPTDLAGDELTDLVINGLRKHALPPGMLQLEITERVMTDHLEATQRTLHRLRSMGVTISLDDFGTGYSSLLRLSSMPVDEIKIDRVFVSCLSEGSRAIGIVRALIELAHALGVPAIAEGVETQQEWEILDALGCDGVQGWHVGMPMARAEVTEWVRSHQLTAVPPRARVHGHVFGPHLMLAGTVAEVVEPDFSGPGAGTGSDPETVATVADDAATV